jgi:prolyl oligopeptidase
MTPDYMIIMKKTLLFLFIAFSLSLHCQKNFEYPPALKSDTSDMYFGTKVPDPYRWLEDINSPQTLNWLSKEALITDQYETGKRSLENGIYEKLMKYGWSASKRLMKRGRYYFHL